MLKAELEVAAQAQSAINACLVPDSARSPVAELEALPLTLVRTAPETSNYFQERSGLRSNGSVWSVALGSCQREEHHQAHARCVCYELLGISLCKFDVHMQ